jgi:hypothetical protein
MFIVQTPFAEVLAVIAQQTVAILPYAGSRAAGYFLTIEIRWRIGYDHPDSATTCETSERDLFHGSGTQAVCQPCVMHDLAIADVDSVM